MNTRNLRFRSNRVSDIIGLFHEELDGMYGSGEVGVFLDMLFEAFLGWDKVRLMTSKEQTIDQSDLLRFHWALVCALVLMPTMSMATNTTNKEKWLVFIIIVFI